MKLGDAVELVAKPIARQIDQQFGTDIEHCGGCGKRRQGLNDMSDKFWDVFWNRGKTKGKKMQFIVIEQTMQQWAIEAETAEQAIKMRQNGEGEVLGTRTQSFSTQVRPKQPPQPRDLTPGRGHGV